MSMNKKENNKTVRSRLYTSVLLVLLALVAVTAATVAWFSIADRAKVKTMSLDIVTDADLRMDLDPHSTIDQYVKTLSFEQIAARIQQEKGFSMETTPLEPVTTTDYETFTYENGTTVENTSGAYLEFTLHFMAAKDMVVSENAALPESMRIAFSTDGTIWNYDPGMGSASSTEGTAKTFGLPEASTMQINEDNAMFSLKEGVDKAVTVHIWMEGTDEACTDELRGSDYSIRLRFTGDKTDDQNK